MEHDYHYDAVDNLPLLRSVLRKILWVLAVALLSRLPWLSIHLLSKFPISIPDHDNRDDHDKLFDRDEKQSYNLNVNLSPSTGIRDKHVNRYNDDNQHHDGNGIRYAYGGFLSPLRGEPVPVDESKIRNGNYLTTIHTATGIRCNQLQMQRMR